MLDQGVTRLTKDQVLAAEALGSKEARFLVDSYYKMQDDRIRSTNQVRALNESGEPNSVIEWQMIQSKILEDQTKRALAKYAESQPIGQWMLSLVGIGPVISAGLLAHIDIEKAITAGSIWRYAGLDPTCEWKKGEKRPFNASLKVICWKIGESFVKVSNHDDDIYGKIYKDRKELETAKNERGDFSAEAEKKLAKYNIGKTTDAYKSYSIGKLPKAHIHARAKRYAVKMFLSHLQEVWWELEFGVKPPVPYAMKLSGHTHKIEPPKKVTNL